MHAIAYTGKALTISLESDGSSASPFSAFGLTSVSSYIEFGLGAPAVPTPFDKHTTGLAALFFRWKLLSVSVEFIPFSNAVASVAIGFSGDGAAQLASVTPAVVMTLSSSRLMALSTGTQRKIISFRPPSQQWLWVSNFAGTTVAAVRQTSACTMLGAFTNTPSVGRYGDFVITFRVAFADPCYGLTVNLDEKHFKDEDLIVVPPCTDANSARAKASLESKRAAEMLISDQHSVHVPAPRLSATPAMIYAPVLGSRAAPGKCGIT
jgi:hypothetical protein